MNKLGKICITNLNQHSLSFNNNLHNIKQSIDFAIKQNCLIRTGVELETSGQSLGSHFLEKETFANVWYMLGEVIKQSKNSQLIIELGMPLQHNNNIYSSLAYIQNGQIKNFRIKQKLINNQQVQQSVFFDEYNFQGDIKLPEFIQKINNQKEINVNNKQFNINKNLNYFSIFEEEFNLLLNNKTLENIDILNIANSQIFEAENFNKKIQKLQKISKQFNTKILLSGLVGTEGSKFIHQGGQYIIDKDKVYELNQRFQFDNIQQNIITIIQDKDEVKIHEQVQNNITNNPQKKLQEYQSLNRVEEISSANCLYLWNQMLKTRCCGFFTPLSGGADSGLTSMFLYNMCNKIVKSSKGVKEQFTQLTDFQFNDNTQAKDLVNKIYYTAYLPMKFSNQTKDNSKKLATAINSNHMIFSIQESFDSIKDSLENQLDMKIDFLNNSKSLQQDLILQNIQARTRLVLSYALSQSLVVKYKLKSFLLVFATGNFSEVCRGYYSKYDNSSGDLNLVGSLCKEDIWNVLRYYSKEKGFDFLQDIVNQKPTAELRPENDNQQQSDEQDMGFTYEELDYLGKTWKINKLGFWQLAEAFQKRFNLKEEESFKKVQNFFNYLKINRHKAICLPPTSHLTDYNIDNNNDIRPMNYCLDKNIDKEEINKFL